MLDAGQIMDDLVPASLQEEGKASGILDSGHNVHEEIGDKF